MKYKLAVKMIRHMSKIEKQSSQLHIEQLARTGLVDLRANDPRPGPCT
jgi:hypothetical protein